MAQIRIREGFKDQLLYVIPRSLLPRFTEHPLVHSLIPTDIGWYPNARFHYCERPKGTAEHILMLCVDGSGSYEINGVSGTLQRGQAVLLPRSTPHRYWASAREPWSIYWVHFTGTNADLFARQLLPREYVLDIDAHAMGMLRQLFTACCNALMTGFVLERIIYASQTLHHLLGCLFFDNRAFSPTLQTSRFHNLDATLAFLEQNVRRPLTLAEMAQHADLSPSHFSRLFKEQTSYSPMDYFIHLKIQHASQLLFLTRMPVREIAYELGYDDPCYFSRLFKRVVGVSPIQYRKQPTGGIEHQVKAAPRDH